jgi:hypothetical protein
MRGSIREALDEGELADDLAALVLDVLLGLLEVVVGRVLGEGNLVLTLDRQHQT